VPSPKKRQFWLQNRTSIRRRLATRTKVRRNLPSAVPPCGASKSNVCHGGKRKGLRVSGILSMRSTRRFPSVVRGSSSLPRCRASR
jgi:hypothetical protein